VKPGPPAERRSSFINGCFQATMLRRLGQLFLRDAGRQDFVDLRRPDLMTVKMPAAMISSAPHLLLYSAPFQRRSRGGHDGDP
jgi:hypothetical protein